MSNLSRRELFALLATGGLAESRNKENPPKRDIAPRDSLEIGLKKLRNSALWDANEKSALYLRNLQTDKNAWITASGSSNDATIFMDGLRKAWQEKEISHALIAHTHTLETCCLVADIKNNQINELRQKPWLINFTDPPSVNLNLSANTGDLNMLLKVSAAFGNRLPITSLILDPSGTWQATIDPNHPFIQQYYRDKLWERGAPSHSYGGVLNNIKTLGAQCREASIQHQNIILTTRLREQLIAEYKNIGIEQGFTPHKW